MTPERAAELLGLTGGTPQELQAAYRAAALRLTRGELIATAQELKAALQFLTDGQAPQKKMACPFCRGSGIVVIGLRQMPCPSCGITE